MENWTFSQRVSDETLGSRDGFMRVLYHNSQIARLPKSTTPPQAAGYQKSIPYWIPAFAGMTRRRKRRGIKPKLSNKKTETDLSEPAMSG